MISTLECEYILSAIIQMRTDDLPQNSFSCILQKFPLVANLRSPLQNVRFLECNPLSTPDCNLQLLSSIFSRAREIADLGPAFSWSRWGDPSLNFIRFGPFLPSCDQVWANVAGHYHMQQFDHICLI